MARSFAQVACLAVVLSLCPVLPAFQAPGGDSLVSIEPRLRPRIVPVANALPNPDIRVDSSLVLVPAHVTTAFGASITDLGKKNFEIFEDGVSQTIRYFSKEEAPLSVGLLFDVSGSMRDKIHKAAEAAAAFFRTSNPQDEFFLVEFSEKPKLKVPFTTDTDQVYNRISHARPFGRTALLDAIHMAMEQLKSARNPRKAIVIVSDGGDNRSRHTAREIRDELLETDAQVYAMGIFEEDTHKLPAEERNGPRLLEELAEDSGGREYPVENLDDLPAISEHISNELRDQYLIGYAPSNDARDGKFRTIKLVIEGAANSAQLRTYYRHGYYAPIR
ncbi:MAG TPA: VWA domain-containing protein [Bryobacteraceae bacterium]|nr:VWA domain-containing protein [Bryobacteraceae bacterium]